MTERNYMLLLTVLLINELKENYVFRKVLFFIHCYDKAVETSLSGLLSLSVLEALNHFSSYSVSKSY